MLTAALLELLPQPEAFVERLNGLGIPGVTYHRERAEKCGITGTHITVTVDGHTEGEHDHDHDHDHDHEHEHHHHHSGMEEISHLIGHLPVSEKVRADIRAVYDAIAQAESHVHGVPVTDIHFHEVGTMDAVAGRDGGVPADGGAGGGSGDRLPGACGQRHRPLRPRRSAGACPGHGISPAGCTHLWRGHPGGAVYPHRGGFAAALRYPLRRPAGDDPGDRGLWHGTEGLSPGQLPASHAGGDGGGERRRGGAGLQPGRHDRRGHRLRHGAGCWLPGHWMCTPCPLA